MKDIVCFSELSQHELQESILIHLMTESDDTLYQSTFINITYEISQTILITREFYVNSHLISFFCNTLIHFDDGLCWTVYQFVVSSECQIILKMLMNMTTILLETQFSFEQICKMVHFVKVKIVCRWKTEIRFSRFVQQIIK